MEVILTILFYAVALVAIVIGKITKNPGLTYLGATVLIVVSLDMQLSGIDIKTGETSTVSTNTTVVNEYTTYNTWYTNATAAATFVFSALSMLSHIV